MPKAPSPSSKSPSFHQFALYDSRPNPQTDTVSAALDRAPLSSNLPLFRQRIRLRVQLLEAPGRRREVSKFRVLQSRVVRQNRLGVPPGMVE